ncbi:acyl-CoA dehydrogenase, partial [Arthrobacter sp. APC 3897]|nr:acyl-CoA dehydrogenase [Arthrobacter sp. APC 3897]
DLRLQAARAALDEAAARVDAGDAEGRAGAILAQRVRGIVADAAEEVLALADHGLGPGPLALDEEHARRTADLRIYLRQHHAERDHAALGRSLLQGGVCPW